MKMTESLPSNQALVVVSTPDARLFIKTATHLRLFSHGPNKLDHCWITVLLSYILRGGVAMLLQTDSKQGNVSRTAWDAATLCAGANLHENTICARANAPFPKLHIGCENDRTHNSLKSISQIWYWGLILSLKMWALLVLDDISSAKAKSNAFPPFQQHLVQTVNCG